jgi:YVTN family beta-propeller protein
MENSVSIINTTSLKRETLKVGEHPYCVAISVDGKFIYVTNTQDDNVSVIDLSSKETIVKIKVGEVPEGINTDPKTGNIYVASWSSNQVSVIDGKHHKLLMHIKTGDKSRAFGKFILEDYSPY